MLHRSSAALLIIFTMICHRGESARVRFSKVLCNVTDPQFAKIDWCTLKAESRYVQFFKARVTVFKLPINEFTIRFQFMTRLSGWKPFLYDITVGCNFTRHLNKLTRMMWNVVKNATNVQHDCPYDQPLEITRAENTLIGETLKNLPVPNGDYAVFATFNVDNITRGYANFYGSVF